MILRLSRSKLRLSQSKLCLSQSKLCLSQSKLCLSRSKLHLSRSKLRLSQSKLRLSRSNVCSSRSNVCSSRSDVALTPNMCSSQNRTLNDADLIMIATTTVEGKDGRSRDGFMTYERSANFIFPFMAGLYGTARANSRSSVFQ